MDPDEALRRIREAIGALRAAENETEPEKAIDDLLEHVEALDGWLSKGGFLPASWTGAKR